MVLQVQTGFGRTGEHYWGFEMNGVIPDIGKIILPICCYVGGMTLVYPITYIIRQSEATMTQQL